PCTPPCRSMRPLTTVAISAPTMPPSIPSKRPMRFPPPIAPFSRETAACALLPCVVVPPDFRVLRNHSGYSAKRRLRRTKQLQCIPAIGGIPSTTIDVQSGKTETLVMKSGRKTDIAFEEIEPVDGVHAIKQ